VSETNGNEQPEQTPPSDDTQAPQEQPKKPRPKKPHLGFDDHYPGRVRPEQPCD